MTSKQADSARLHEVPARRKLPLMLCSAAVQQRALQHSQMLGSSLHGHPYPKWADSVCLLNVATGWRNNDFPLRR